MTCNCRAYLAKAWKIICLLTVEPARFLVSLGDGMSETATRVLMYDKVCIMLLKDIDRCIARNFTSEEQIIVQQEASIWEFYRTLANYLPAVFLIVIYSNLVDRWSKKYTILFCPVGYILCMIVYLVCSIYMESSPAYMLLGTLVLGFSGGLMGMQGACFSYISATASQGMLLVHLSLAEAARSSNAIASFVSGVLLEAVGYVLFYFIGIVILVVSSLYIIIRIKNIPLSPSIIVQSDASALVQASTASEPSTTPVGNEDALKKADTLEQNADNEINIHTNSVTEIENAEQLNPLVECRLTNQDNDTGAKSYSGNGETNQEKCTAGLEQDDGVKSSLENGIKTQEKSPGGLEQDAMGKSSSDIWFPSHANGVLGEVSEIKTLVEDGSMVNLSMLPDGLLMPSQNSANEPQPELFSSDIALLDPKSGKSNTCGTCSLCIRAAWMIWFYIRTYINTATKRREHNKRRGFIAILCIILITVTSLHATAVGLCYLFVTDEPLSWSTSTYGYYMGMMGGAKCFCLLVMMPLFKRMNVPFTVIIVISLASSIFGNTIFALSLYTWMAFLSAMFTLFQYAFIVAARSITVTLIEEDEHGKAFGMIGSLESVAFILSTIVFNIGIYPATVSIHPGLAILIAALILLIPLAIAIWLHVSMRNVASRLQLQVIANTIEVVADLENERTDIENEEQQHIEKTYLELGNDCQVYGNDTPACAPVIIINLQY